MQTLWDKVEEQQELTEPPIADLEGTAEILSLGFSSSEEEGSHEETSKDFEQEMRENYLNLIRVLIEEQQELRAEERRLIEKEKKVREEINLLKGEEDPLEKDTLPEVVKSMKTGRQVLIEASTRNRDTDRLMLDSEPDSIEGAFESSYLRWLALAKINHTLIAVIGKAAVDMEKAQKEIVERVKGDALLRALEEAS
jgi:hypothetical protein